MTGVIVFSLTRGDWFAIGVLALVTAVLAAPVCWLCSRFVQMDDDAVVCTIEDVERFVELTDIARREMTGSSGVAVLDSRDLEAATEAIDGFIARKEIARKALWRAPLSRVAASPWTAAR